MADLPKKPEPEEGASPLWLSEGYFSENSSWAPMIEAAPDAGYPPGFLENLREKSRKEDQGKE